MPTGDPHEDTSDVDPAEVARDERLVEEVRSGTSVEAFRLAVEMARHRDAVQADTPRYADPATSGLPHARYDDPRFNPIAFLPVPPEPGRRVEYGGHVDWAATEREREPQAVTAGQEDHSDPWRYAGEPADPPEDAGRPADG